MRQHQLSPSTPHPPAPSYPFAFVEAEAKDAASLSPSGVTGVTDSGVERRIVLPGGGGGGGGVGAEESREEAVPAHEETVNHPHPPHHHHLQQPQQQQQQQSIILPQLQLSSEQQQQLQIQLQHMRSLQNVRFDSASFSTFILTCWLFCFCLRLPCGCFVSLYVSMYVYSFADYAFVHGPDFGWLPTNTWRFYRRPCQS